MNSGMLKILIEKVTDGDMSLISSNQDNDTLKTIKLYGKGVKKVVRHLDLGHWKLVSE
jgi:hypothetical protein